MVRDQTVVSLGVGISRSFPVIACRKSRTALALGSTPRPRGSANPTLRSSTPQLGGFAAGHASRRATAPGSRVVVGSEVNRFVDGRRRNAGVGSSRAPGDGEAGGRRCMFGRWWCRSSRWRQEKIGNRLIVRSRDPGCRRMQSSVLLMATHILAARRRSFTPR